MDIYLDTCALNRLTDDPSQPRVRREAQAVAHILELAFTGEVRWIASAVLQKELDRNPDPLRRLRTQRVLSNATEVVSPDAEAFSRAAEFCVQGLGVLDALHLATAQQAGVEALLTTDDRFLRRSTLLLRGARPEVLNPVDWLQRRQPWLLPNPFR